MANFLKIIGSGQDPCPEPYKELFVDFSPSRNPKGKINVGDELILYAAGGRRSVFARAKVVSDVYGGDNAEWPYRLDVVYESNVPPAEGVPIGDVSVERDLVVSVRRQSYIRLSDAEFDEASRLLEIAGETYALNRKYFTSYWKNDTWEENSQLTGNGELLDHTASNDFRERGISSGDAVYVVTVQKGKLHVSAKIIVGQILNRSEAMDALGHSNLWDASDHIIASRSTPINWQLEIPLKITEQLEFFSAAGLRSKLVFRSPGELDEQTLRGVRRLSSESASLIDALLGPLRSVDYLWIETPESGISSLKDLEPFAERKKKSKFVTFYERDPKNRAAAVRIHGYTCKGCGINFEKKYGPWGKDFIHVHHVKPVSQFERPKQIDPRIDLTVLCPNCHAMVHKKKTKSLSIEELREIIRVDAR